ncbi:transcriptional regulator, TetR family [Lentzea aerocolonigenes]|nr:transcriptional regulator, TetR family [Lentzea aerocolonigenes]
MHTVFVKDGVRGRVGQAGPLNRARIVRAAMRVVERDGVEVLTMRRLADEIGTAPMSLYRHVADKREVLMELLEAVSRQITGRRLPASPDPRRRLLDTVTVVHDVLEGNRWVVQAVLAVEELPPSALHLSEHMFAAMREAGLDERAAAVAHTAIWHYTWGHVFFGHLSATSARTYDQQEPAGRDGYEELAHVAPAMRELMTRDVFREGLEAMVDGFLAR